MQPAELAALTAGDAVLAHGVPVAAVPRERWLAAATAVHAAGAVYLDALLAVDEGDGLSVVLHLRDAGRVTLVTRCPYRDAWVPSLVPVWPGAAWHERTAWEMLGVEFPGHPGLVPLLLPDGFEGRPLRKDFVLASRGVTAWPGAPEPGESREQASRRTGRRRGGPPGVPPW